MHHVSKRIYIVDRDPASCARLRAILKQAGHDVICFGDTDALLSAASILVPVCILAELEFQALEILRRLNATTYPAPVLMMSEERFVDTMIDLIKEGAYDFLEKPFSGAELIQRIERARFLFACKDQGQRYLAGHEPHTNREREVLSHWIAGATTKEIARKLGVSPRTVETHRSRIMKKFRAKNSAQIVKLALSSNVELDSRLGQTA